MLRNVLEDPQAERYRTVRLANATFHQRVGSLPSGLALMRAFGFEDARAAGDGAPDGAVTHLAMPVADAAGLARGLVLLRAAREALVLVDDVPKPGRTEEPYTRAEGKRPARCDDLAARPPTLTSRPAPTVGPSGAGAAPPDAAPPELTDFSAASIERFFAEHAGAECAGLASAGGAARLGWLVRAAMDAVRVTAADAPAAQAAARWLALLAEHGALLGWRGEDGADGAAGAVGGAADEDEDEDVDDGGGDGDGDGDGDGACAPAADLFPIGSDGNFEACAECGAGGDLVCCDGCPHVYHADCLGPFAPALDDDAQWYCPECARALGM